MKSGAGEGCEVECDGKVSNAAVEAKRRARERRIVVGTDLMRRDSRIHAATAGVIPTRADGMTSKAASAADVGPGTPGTIG